MASESSPSEDAGLHLPVVLMLSPFPLASTILGLLMDSWAALLLFLLDSWPSVILSPVLVLMMGVISALFPLPSKSLGLVFELDLWLALFLSPTSFSSTLEGMPSFELLSAM